MFSSKHKAIKGMFSLKSAKKVEKVISKFFLFNEGIRCSEKSRAIREACDGEDVRVLSSSSSDDGEDTDDADDNDGSDGGNDNNGATTMLMEGLMMLVEANEVGAMSTNPNYYTTQDLNSSNDYLSGHDNYSRGYQSLESHMHSLSLTSGQQLERSASIRTGFSIYCMDNYDDDFVSLQFNVKMTILACIYECILSNLLYYACILIFFYR